MTGADRVLRALERAGERGITRVDFQAPTIDGDVPILNIPARIHELEAQGHEIFRSGRRNRCTAYVLASAVSSASTPTAPASYPAAAHDGSPESSPPERDPSGVDADKTAPQQLFDTTDQEFDHMVPPLSPYDQEAA